MTMALLTFVAFLVGIFSHCYSAPSQPPVEESIFTFELNGISHTETRKVEGSIVTLTDSIDGFLVILDYERNIFILKNLTSETCSFSRLDNIPVSKDEKVPLFVQEVTEASLQENGGQEVDVVLLEKVGTIPVGYVRLTNDVTVAEECSSQPSYWLETKDISRQRRFTWDKWGRTDESVLIAQSIYYTVKTIAEVISWFG